MRSGGRRSRGGSAAGAWRPVLGLAYLPSSCCFTPSPPARPQAAGLVPIVEPEILIDGGHDQAAFGDASARVISRCVAHLWQKVTVAW